MVVNFFHHIYRAYGGGFRPHILQSLLQYLVLLQELVVDVAIAMSFRHVDLT